MHRHAFVGCVFVVLWSAEALPLPTRGDPLVHVPATFQGSALLVPYWDELGTVGSFRAFLSSLGLGSLPSLREEMWRILGRLRDEPLYVELCEVVAAHGGVRRGALRAAIPVMVGESAFLVEWRDGGALEAARAFVERVNESVVLNATTAAARAGKG